MPELMRAPKFTIGSGLDEMRVYDSAEGLEEIALIRPPRALGFVYRGSDGLSMDRILHGSIQSGIFTSAVCETSLNEMCNEESRPVDGIISPLIYRRRNPGNPLCDMILCAQGMQPFIPSSAESYLKSEVSLEHSIFPIIGGKVDLAVRLGNTTKVVGVRVFEKEVDLDETFKDVGGIDAFDGALYPSTHARFLFEKYFNELIMYGAEGIETQLQKVPFAVVLSPISIMKYDNPLKRKDAETSGKGSLLMAATYLAHPQRN